MKSVSLNAFPRQLGRRSGSKKLRSEGRIPAVIYGRQTQPQNLELQAKEIEDLIHRSVSENLLVDLDVKEDARPKRLALVQEIQHHPSTGKLLHIDFHEVAENEKVTVAVALESTGEPEGVTTGGGVLEHVLFKIKVRALPKDLPEVITVDVSNLKLGDSIHLGDIQPPAGVEILGDKHISAFSVAVPRAEEEEAAATAEGAAGAGDVEMLKEKKEDGEGAAPAAKAGEKGAAGDKKAAAPAAGDKKAAAPAEKKK